MNNSRILGALSLVFALLLSAPICYGQFDLLYVGGANGTFDTGTDWDGGFKPEFQFMQDSLTFGATPAGGATVDNDLDPANNGGIPLQVGLGSDPAGTSGGGSRDDSAAIHFLDGAGDFTLTGFPIQVNASSGAQLSAFRIEPTAGTLQTINNDISFALNAGARIIQLNTGSGGKLVLNGDVDLGTGFWFFGDTNLASPAHVEFNGAATGTGGGVQTAASWATGGNVPHPGNTRNQVIRLNAGDLQRTTIESANGTHIVAGNSQAFGDSHSGTWETDTLNYRFLSSTRVERFNDGYADNNSISVKAGVDLSEYGLQTVFGSNWNFRGENDTTIGWLQQVWAREDLNASMDNYPNPNHPTAPGREIQPWGSLTVDGDATLSIAAHGGIFVSFYDGAEQYDLRLPGTSGEVAGANGRMVINGKLYNSFISPSAQASNGTTATGGIEPGAKAAVGTGALALFAKPGQLTGEDGSLVNGSITVSYGTLTLNGDSGSTWKGSQFRAMNGSTTIIGHDNALGDAGSIVSIEGDSTVDTGTHTVAQKFVNTDGTIRGNGTLTNEADWSIAGSVQPGGETPAATDTLTFDFSGASAANTLTFESSSSVDFVLDAGTASSTVDVLGSTVGGMTDIVFDDNVFAFTDLAGGSLSDGAYTLFDGDANTSYALGGGVTITGLGAYSSSSLAIVGDDLVLNLVGGGGLTGDFDGDGDVDGADFLAWQRNDGTPGGLADWQNNYPNPLSASSAAAAVPEPASLCLLAIGAVFMGVRRRLA